MVSIDEGCCNVCRTFIIYRKYVVIYRERDLDVGMP